MRDLCGRRIAVYPGMTSELAVKYFLRRNNVNVDNINFVRLPPPEHEQALLRGDVDAIHLYEPYRTASISSNRTRELCGSIYASFNDPSAMGVSAISRKMLTDNPKLAKRFLLVWNQAVQFIRENPEKARLIMANKLALPTNVARHATWVDVTKTNECNFDTINQTIRSCQNAGIISRSFLFEKDMIYE